MAKKDAAKFAALYDKAKAAGFAAGQGARPVPMIVGQALNLVGNEIDYNKPVYHVADGACGFAWVEVHPGNCAFALWLKKNSLAHKGYPVGMHIWIADHGQAVARKEAHAYAMAAVLKEAGINAYANSRLD